MKTFDEPYVLSMADDLLRHAKNGEFVLSGSVVTDLLESSEILRSYAGTLAELERYRMRAWGLVSPSSNAHDTSCTVECTDPTHYPDGDPFAPDDNDKTARIWKATIKQSFKSFNMNTEDTLLRFVNLFDLDGEEFDQED